LVVLFRGTPQNGLRGSHRLAFLALVHTCLSPFVGATSGTPCNHSHAHVKHPREKQSHDKDGEDRVLCPGEEHEESAVRGPYQPQEKVKALNPLLPIHRRTPALVRCSSTTFPHPFRSIFPQFPRPKTVRLVEVVSSYRAKGRPCQSFDPPPDGWACVCRPPALRATADCVPKDSPAGRTLGKSHEFALWERVT